MIPEVVFSVVHMFPRTHEISDTGDKYPESHNNRDYCFCGNFVEKNQNTQDYEINKYIINGGYYWGNSKSVTVNFEDLEGYPTPECKVSMYFEAFEGVDTYGYTTNEWNSITF